MYGPIRLYLLRHHVLTIFTQSINLFSYKFSSEGLFCLFANIFLLSDADCIQERFSSLYPSPMARGSTLTALLNGIESKVVLINSFPLIDCRWPLKVRRSVPSLAIFNC